MPRDGNGNYTVPAGMNPVVGGTDILADGWANPTLTDIAAAITDSLSRSGSGGMLAPFKFADGTSGAPSVSWTNQPQAGFYRAGNDDIRYVINGIDVMQLRPPAAGGNVFPTQTNFLNASINGQPIASQNDAIAYAIALG